MRSAVRRIIYLQRSNGGHGAVNGPESPFFHRPITIDNAYSLYVRLKDFLARTKDCFWGGSIDSYIERQTVMSFLRIYPDDGRWYAIRWMPKLKGNWVRLTFEEFLRYYKLIPKEAK